MTLHSVQNNNFRTFSSCFDWLMKVIKRANNVLFDFRRLAVFLLFMNYVFKYLFGRPGDIQVYNMKMNGYSNRIVLTNIAARV